RSGVWVDARVSSVEPGEQRSGGAEKRHAHPRLKNAVPFSPATRSWIESGPVQRMRDDANELPGDVAGQPSIAVECDAVPDVRQDREVAGVECAAGICRTPQPAVEFLA